MPRWELRIQRRTTQSNGEDTRTVGEYRVCVDGEEVPGLTGMTAESEGPGDNSEEDNGKRIEARTYPLWTHDGDDYETIGYTESEDVGDGPKPGLKLKMTGARTAILVHPGKNEFLSSTGCINLCTNLPDADERIDYPGSRRRVIALIEHLRQVVDGFPTDNNERIPDAWVVIEGEP